MTSNGNGNGAGVIERFSRPQQWTLLSLLAVLTIGGGWLQHTTSKDNNAAVVSAVEKVGTTNAENTKALVAAQEKTCDVLGGLLLEIKLQGQQQQHVNTDSFRERDRAVEAIKEAIRGIPQAVAERIGAPRKQ